MIIETKATHRRALVLKRFPTLTLPLNSDSIRFPLLVSCFISPHSLLAARLLRYVSPRHSSPIIRITRWKPKKKEKFTYSSRKGAWHGIEHIRITRSYQLRLPRRFVFSPLVTNIICLCCSQKGELKSLRHRGIRLSSWNIEKKNGSLIAEPSTRLLIDWPHPSLDRELSTKSPGENV